MNQQAEELNRIIQEKSGIIFELLSKKGKEIYFPKKGIVGQAAEAQSKKINATAGVALDDNGQHMFLKSIERNLNLPPSLAVPYAPNFGRADIRAAWKKMIVEKNPSIGSKLFSLPIVTNALTHGLSVAGYLFLDEGDKVILSDHYWDNYELVFGNAYGAVLDKFNLFKNGAFDSDSLRAKLNEGAVGKKVLLLNFPNNPSGYTPTVGEMKAIAEIIKNAAEKGNKIVVVLDDAYFGLVFEKGIAKESIFTQLMDLHENVLAVKLDGPTKEDYVWGLRVGFLTYGIKGGNTELYSALESKTAGVVRGNISSVSNLSQSLMLAAFEAPDYEQEKKEKFAILKERYEAVRSTLQNEKYAEYFSPLPYNSGYFMCLELKHGLKAEDVRQKLLEKYDTGVIVIGDVVRIAFSAVSVKLIPEIFENIYSACKDLASL
ncbi:MAG: aminotransferase class I/II-fold pyridoxal phosphate-dependent enzyme [Patescibacteria group bacterium]|nr:aminotransferase class I/II-fold pyridoxal phosphate-dependent enzyme [Patescibacteria group bacterium]